MGLADRIALMHLGRIEQVDTPMAIYRRPGTTLRGLVRRQPADEFPERAVEGGRGRLGALSLAAPIGQGTLLAGVRPEDFEIGQRSGCAPRGRGGGAAGRAHAPDPVHGIDRSLDPAEAGAKDGEDPIVEMSGDQGRKTIFYTDGHKPDAPAGVGTDVVEAKWDGDKLVSSSPLPKKGSLTRTYEVFAGWICNCGKKWRW